MKIEKAIEVLKEYLVVNPYGFDTEKAIETVLQELEKQKKIKAEMRKVAWEEGYNQGYLAGVMDSTSGKE